MTRAAGTFRGCALEHQGRETRYVRWRQSKRSRHLVVSSARTFGIIDGIAKRTRSICRVFVTQQRSSVVAEACEANRRPVMWDDFCRALREQFRPTDYGRRGRDDLATMRQYARESVADFVFRFCPTCLKVPDLSEAEKLDRFVHALVQEIRLQVELRGPANFHNAAMFTERADAVITRVASHDVRKAGSQKSKWGNFQRSIVPMKKQWRHQYIWNWRT